MIKQRFLEIFSFSICARYHACVRVYVCMYNTYMYIRVCMYVCVKIILAIKKESTTVMELQ